MQVPDIINGCFELFGGFIICLSIRDVLKKQQVAGVSLMHIAFFNAWGLWNVFYYPHIGQWASFIGGIGVLIANTVWLSLCIYYCRAEISSFFLDFYLYLAEFLTGLDKDYADFDEEELDSDGFYK